MGNGNSEECPVVGESVTTGKYVRAATVAAVTVREKLRDYVRGAMEDLLDGATEEEIWFMRDVLIARESQYWPAKGSEIPLVAAFLDLIGNQPKAAS